MRPSEAVPAVTLSLSLENALTRQEFEQQCV